MKPRLSVIVPVLNEAPSIASTLAALRAQQNTVAIEVIVVDGGSSDATRELASPLADRVLCAERGRALQMNAGAVAASGDILLFLHADTILPPNGCAQVVYELRESGHLWGRFDVHIEGKSIWLPLVAALMNWRSRLSGIATGDQAIFVTRDAFYKAGAYPAQPLMEDIELSAALKRLGRPLCLRERVATSGRRWDAYGAWRTIFLMWRLRLLYSLGTPAERLARLYRS